MFWVISAIQAFVLSGGCFLVHLRVPDCNANVCVGTSCFEHRPRKGPLMTCGFEALVQSYVKLTLATKTPMTAVANSGPDEPAAMKVAPATSGGRFKTAKDTLVGISKPIRSFKLDHIGIIFFASPKGLLVCARFIL